MEITITRALAEIKLLDSRINKAIQSLVPIAMTTGKRSIPGYQSNEEFEEKAKSSHQSIKDLIKRRSEIKAAIVKSNAEKKVKIAGVEYTVAEAIDKKNSIQYDEALLQKLKSEYHSAIVKFEHEEERVKDRLDDHLKQVFSRDVKVEKDLQREESDVFIERNQPHLIDPLKLKDEIEKLENEINDFLLNVDFELSTANSLNKIVIPD